MIKKYTIGIYFNTGSEDFLGYSRDCLKMETDEETKNYIVDGMSNDNISRILTFNLNETCIRCVNMRNVVYVDIKEKIENE